MNERLTPKRERLTPARVSAYMSSGKRLQEFFWDTDTSGFGVRVTKKTKLNLRGSKAFIFQGRFNGESIRMTIGDTKVWTLDSARIKARSYQTQIDDGKDPREVKAQVIAADVAVKEARVTAKIEKEREHRLTLRALCTVYSDGLKAAGKLKASSDSFSAFTCHVFTSKFADVPAKQIISEDIADIIRKVFEAGKKRTADITRSYLSAAYNAAMKAKFDAQAPAAFIPFKITSNPVTIIPKIRNKKTNRHLSKQELKMYLMALTDSPVDTLLKIHMMSGAQRIAQLSRITEQDYQSEIGAIKLLDPKGRRLEPREHLVPLAPKSLGLLQDMPKGEKHYFYSNAREAGARVSQISKSMGENTFDIRDLRRTCETMLAQMGISKDLRGQLLSHGIHGVQDQVYNMYEYLPEKLDVLKRWESKLEDILAA
ncbi:integrase family protein [Polynucleobacter sp. CS-Odin-A6]|uniref:tyrosine-type recombinase/integrase n=1 Tax=Polynucleobacter sp. CS-Odin-A6 TaxID=2689106 RepID=UPI001C0DE699|nr:integrase family protein [Polynucleobacter sp. CS-Odin-A6]MBU3620926.1 integrase family protein [Polynucleobacter sp. CS-Odin-A6]